jgi:hypothetical protein
VMMLVEEADVKEEGRLTLRGRRHAGEGRATCVGGGIWGGGGEGMSVRGGQPYGSRAQKRGTGGRGIFRASRALPSRKARFEFLYLAGLRAPFSIVRIRWAVPRWEN